MKNVFDVINLHITEKCNFQCRYCFGIFNSQRELTIESWKLVVDKIDKFFKKIKVEGRINLAGGEPTIVSFLDDLINYIYSKGISVSIITNGSMLSKDKIDLWADKVSMIGVSVDSLKSDTNITIGRKQRDKVIDLDRFKAILLYIKSKGIKLKINTVVSKINQYDDITELYNEIGFDRIKLLQVRVQGNCNLDSKELQISSDEFRDYVKKISGIISNEITVESNDDLESSYVIISPDGYLISNANQQYQKIGNILDESLEDLIIKAEIDINKFNCRYL